MLGEGKHQVVLTHGHDKVQSCELCILRCEEVNIIYRHHSYCIIITIILHNITELTKKNTTFNWSPLCQQSLDAIKTALTNNPILIFPDPN